MSAEATDPTPPLFEIDGAPSEQVLDETDPLWYLLADHLVPHYDHGRRIAWIEGFVAACEAAKGRSGADVDTAGILRHSLSL